MRILALSSWFPYPPDHGARMRVYNLLKYLAQRHEITLLSFVRGTVAAEHVDVVRTYCKVIHTVPFMHYHSRRLRAILGLFLPSPRSVIDTHSPAMARLVKETMDCERFDAVMAFAIGPTGGTAPYVQKVRGTPCVMEDLELSIIKDRIAIQPNWQQRMRLRLTWWKSRNFAARLLRDLDGCTVASTRERDLLLSISPDYQPLAVIPNGVDLALYDGDFGLVDPDALVFPGALTYRANLWAMQFFLTEVFSVVKARYPNVKLYITGRTKGVPMEELSLRDGVIMTGYLDDVRPRVAQSAVCVVPMTVGGGSRLKILEAMALGTPVVSTNKGAEGLEVKHGKNILIADEPAEFADAVLCLLNDETLRAKLSANGKRLVRERYSWDQIGERLDQFLHQTVHRYAHKGAT